VAVRRAKAFSPPARFGSYEVGEPLGRGGMATVFRGEHTLLQRPVAIKFLHENVAASARDRFLREARLLAKLAHRNIVTVFDFGQLDDGTYYQASELIAGETLREHLHARGALPAAMALRFARQLAAGLRSAHDLGVIHRDLKPSNVMVVADAEDVDGSRLKILDFGIAKSLETADPSGDLTKAGVVIGTPGFMSPEQCMGDPEIGPATDVYSLGVVLYVMLCGRAPFAGSDTEDLLDMHVYDHPPRPSEADAAIRPEIDDVVQACLAKRPEHRPAAMRDVIARIDAALVAIGAPAVRNSTPAAIVDPDTIRLAGPERVVRIGAASATTTEPDPVPRRSRMWPVAAATAVVAVIAAVAIASGGDEVAVPPSTMPAAAAVVDATIDAHAAAPIDAAVVAEPAVAVEPPADAAPAKPRPKPAPKKPKPNPSPAAKPPKPPPKPFEEVVY
jgi:tRNA A-37 threonylcarbamoyl transferase component Bud32